MLLSTKARNQLSYLVACDIDYTCCVMCVCNFLLNACAGEVICIDSLAMDNFREAWLINEALQRTGIPSVRWLDEKEYSRLKQAGIPSYVYFLNEEGYRTYFDMRNKRDIISFIISPAQEPKL